MGTLYAVSTPIGNLKDITIRAIEVLLSVDGIACEDTRKTGFLLKEIRSLYSRLVDERNPRLISYYEQNEYKRIPEIVTALKNGFNIALVSDAGTPAISDPGFKLIRECVGQGIRVESIPGPSSVISSLVSSGLPTDKFIFLGYLPKKEGHKKKTLESLFMALQELKSTVIIFEAPHRLAKTLKEIKNVFGDINVVLARELTKIHEEVKQVKISEVLSLYQQKEPKGEFVILFNLGEQGGVICDEVG